MRKILINYASLGFERRQRMNAFTALVNGGVNRCIRYGPNDLDSRFASQNEYLLKQPRGAGYWLWKPQIILDAMARADAEDVIIYSDSRALIRSSLDPLVEACRSLNSGVLGFDVGAEFIERDWTKRDAFVLMDCDKPEYWDTKQYRGGTILFAVRPSSRDFVHSWAELLCQSRIVSDMPSICEEPEFEGFQAHRHDQSVFSLLYKKHGYATDPDLGGKSLGHFVEAHVTHEPSLLEMLPSYLYPGMYPHGGARG